MKRIVALSIIISCLSLFSYKLLAQRYVLESRAGLSISYSFMHPTGQSEVSNSSFVYPGLLSNFKKGSGLTLHYSKHVKSIFWGGLLGSRSAFFDWQFKQAPDVFKDAVVLINSAHLNILLKSRFQERGVLNKIRFFGGIAPGVYQIVVDLPTALNQYVNSNGISTPVFFYSRSVKPGVFVNTGIEYSINNKWAFVIDAGYNYTLVKSSVYLDPNFQWMSLNFSLQLRLARNRNYLHTLYD